MIELLKAVRSERLEVQHKPNSPEAFRQQGEINMLNHVIDALEGGTLLEDWMSRRFPSSDD
jgi:hypothetical protein